MASANSVYVGAESNILKYDARNGLLAAAYVPQNQVSSTRPTACNMHIVFSDKRG